MSVDVDATAQKRDGWCLYSASRSEAVLCACVCRDARMNIGRVKIGVGDGTVQVKEEWVGSSGERVRVATQVGSSSYVDSRLRTTTP
jgi:hypothetical protein